MGVEWVWILLDADETLRCSSCNKYLHDQKVYIFLEDNYKLDEIMCEVCWKENQEETEE